MTGKQVQRQTQLYAQPQETQGRDRHRTSVEMHKHSLTPLTGSQQIKHPLTQHVAFMRSARPVRPAPQSDTPVHALICAPARQDWS
jgi:hypothetical protein